MWTAFARTHYERLNARYASDVTDDEYGLIEPLLPPARRGGRRRTTDLREVLNAILVSHPDWLSLGTCCRVSSHPRARSTGTSDDFGRMAFGIGSG